MVHHNNDTIQVSSPSQFTESESTHFTSRGSGEYLLPLVAAIANMMAIYSRVIPLRPQWKDLVRPDATAWREGLSPVHPQPRRGDVTLPDAFQALRDEARGWLPFWPITLVTTVASAFAMYHLARNV